MISKVISERERFWVRSVRERMEKACALLRSLPEDEAKGQMSRAKLLLSFAQLAESVIDRFLSSRLADFNRFGLLEKAPRAAADRRR